MADHADDGLLEAHTPPRDPSSAADPATPGAVDGLPGADPLDLLAGLPDGEGDDVLALVAELVAAPARARGRPAGSANRKNGDVLRYLAARGHRDPLVTLSMIQSADFAGLCRMVGADSAKAKIAVLGVIRSAAADMLPYAHSKKPQQLELPTGDKRPLMVIGEMNVSVAGDLGFMSAGEMPPSAGEKINEINGTFVRQPSAEPHETANALKGNDE